MLGVCESENRKRTHLRYMSLMWYQQGLGSVGLVDVNLLEGLRELLLGDIGP